MSALAVLFFAFIGFAGLTGCTGNSGSTGQTTATNPVSTPISTPISTPTLAPNSDDVTSKTSTKSGSQIDQSSVDLARAALETYFLMLSSGNYELALKYHGAGFETFQTWNPTETDKIKLLEKGCTANGLQCLQAREITDSGVLANGDHEFKVSFRNKDGSLFVTSVIEGEATSDLSDRSLFKYHVRNYGQGFVVLELPPYSS